MVDKLKVINLYAGPGAGKSTTAAGLFYLMKLNKFKVELVTEFAKDKVYERHSELLEDQLYVFAKQQRRLKRLVGQVDWAITDSPLLLSILYNKEYKNLNPLILEEYEKYDNLNFLIGRVKAYEPFGRLQTETEAKELDTKLINILEQYNIPSTLIEGDKVAHLEILKKIGETEEVQTFIL